jgi:hypothetical protein
LEDNVNRLNTKFDKLSSSIENLIKPVPSCEPFRPSYATISRKTKQPVPLPRKVSILLKPTVTTPLLDTADKVKETLQKKINPADKGWQVVRLRKKGETEVVLDATSPEAAQKIINDTDIRNCGLSATVIPKSTPKIIIYNILRTMEDADVLQALHLQNFDDTNKEEFLAKIRPVFKTGKKDCPATNIVFEVKPVLRNNLFILTPSILDGQDAGSWTASVSLDALNVNFLDTLLSTANVRKQYAVTAPNLDTTSEIVLLKPTPRNALQASQRKSNLIMTPGTHNVPPT